MSTASEMLRLPCPVPACESKIALNRWVYVLADRARAKLIASGGIGHRLFPLGSVAASVAEECMLQAPGDIKDKNEAEFRQQMDAKPLTAAAWLAGAIVEILSMDPVTQTWLRSHGLPSREVRKAGKQAWS